MENRERQWRTEREIMENRERATGLQTKQTFPLLGRRRHRGQGASI